MYTYDALPFRAFCAECALAPAGRACRQVTLRRQRSFRSRQRRSRGTRGAGSRDDGGGGDGDPDPAHSTIIPTRIPSIVRAARDLVREVAP